MTTDAAAAREFYSTLFGWSFAVGGPETGGYGMASLGGRDVAGVGSMQGMEHPPVWTTYLASLDAAATVSAIVSAGGTVVQPPIEVGESGIMAVAQDPTGGTFGIWEAGKHRGVALANEPGALAWNELMTRDYEAALSFYGSVFGYGFDEIGDEGFRYSTMSVDGHIVGGLGAMPAEVPAEVPPHWRTYFAVSDTDDVVARAASLGASVLRPPADMPYGRWADLADPQGAMFSVIKSASPS